MFQSDHLNKIHQILRADQQVVEWARVSELEDGLDYGIATYLSAFVGEMDPAALDIAEEVIGPGDTEMGLIVKDWRRRMTNE